MESGLCADAVSEQVGHRRYVVAAVSHRNRSCSLYAMNRVILILFAILLLKVMLPARKRRTNSSVKPYSSVFDAAVPADLSCSPLCDPIEILRQRARIRIRAGRK